MTTPVFHRLTVPSYFGGLPSDYDYINNATSGTPAPANGVIPTGLNAGSYFTAFQEPAASANVNRGNLALAPAARRPGELRGLGCLHSR